MLDAARREVLSKPPRNANAYGHQAAAGQLLFIGLYDEAAPEYEASLLADRSDRVGAGTPQKLPADAAYTLAELYRRGDRGDRAASLFGQVSGRGGEIQPELADPQFAKFDYPAPYVGSLKRAADVMGVDPRFLLAIIRQESGFRPNVKSNASARGLMQFIPSTAELTARGAGLTAFRDDDLYDPNVSITLGGRYVSELFKLFPDLPEAVAASYNGGEDNMKRWLSRSKSRVPERYVAEIAYGQSKDYVYRVMSNYRMYRLLYDRGLELKRPPLSDD
jgi:soluble lytic murein transglycosylase